MFSDFALFRRNVSWLTVSELTKMVCWWGLLVAIGKLIGVEAVGQFGLAVALTSPVAMFTNLGLRNAIATDVADRFPFPSYFALRLVTNVGLLAIVLTLAAVLSYGSTQFALIAVFSIFKVVEAQSNVCFGLFQKNLRLDVLARSKLIRAPLELIFLTLGIAISDQLLGGLIGLFLAELLVFVFYDLRQVPRFLTDSDGERAGEAAVDLRAWVRAALSIFRPEGQALRSLAYQAFPLGLVGLLGSLQLNLPRIFVESILGVAALGYFTAISAFYGALTRVINTVGHSASARLARDYRDRRWRDFIVLLAVMGLVACCAGLAASAIAFGFGAEFLTLLFTPDFADYQVIFGLVMLAAGLRMIANLWQVGVVAARRFWLYASLHLLVAIATVVAAPLLISEFALSGAAWALILSAGIHALGVVAVLSVLVARLARAH